MSDLYNTDFFAWTQREAAKLRRIAREQQKRTDMATRPKKAARKRSAPKSYLEMMGDTLTKKPSARKRPEPADTVASLRLRLAEAEKAKRLNYEEADRYRHECHVLSRRLAHQSDIMSHLTASCNALSIMVEKLMADPLPARGEMVAVPVMPSVRVRKTEGGSDGVTVP